MGQNSSTEMKASEEESPLYDCIEQMNVENAVEAVSTSTTDYTPSSSTADCDRTITDSKKIVAAIDFGTTYSGYAYTFKTEYDKDSNSREIFVNKWQTSIGSGESQKAPTTALYDPNGKFDSFGYEAEEKYAELVEKKEHEGWKCFRRFKMKLHNNIIMRRGLCIEDENGAKMEALDVFADCIRYLKDHLQDTLDSRNPGFRGQTILWVLTIPAIWNEKAKQFMREAANKAGIENSQLQFALEPEAAAVYCRSLPQSTLWGSEDDEILACFKPGGKYMILDLGGGTVDTAVHQVSDSGGLVELYKASGGAWGGTKVDEEFYKLIEETFGSNVVPEIKAKYLWDWMKMSKEFESRKRQITTDPHKTVRVQIPPRFFVNSKQSFDFMKSFDKLELNAEQLQTFFKPVTDKIVSHVKDVLSKVPDLKLILMVGGFSESQYVKDNMIRAFSDNRIIVPLQAGTAVLQGAVLFGFNPSAITARICRHTYGVRVVAPFIEGDHCPSFKAEMDGRDVCKNIFKIMANEGETVALNEKRTANMGSSHTSELRRHMDLTLPVFASEKRKPKYTTEEGCVEMGVVGIRSPKSGWRENEIFEVSMFFGRTEFRVVVDSENSSQQAEAYFDFLKDD